MGIFFAATCSKTQEEFLPAQGSNAQRIVNGLKLCTKKIVHTLITVYRLSQRNIDAHVLYIPMTSLSIAVRLASETKFRCIL